MKRENGPNQVLKLICAGLACIMSNLGLATDYPLIVAIPDENLEAAIREHLDIPTGPINAYQIGSIVHLSAISWEIKDLSGLQYASNLVELDLNNNQIEDLRPLAGLIRLRILKLGNNQIADLRPLEGLTNLIKLDLHGNQIKEIGSLCRFGRITALSLNDNQIKDVQPLAELTSLQRLNLANNYISNPSPLVGLHNLTSSYLLPGMDPNTYRPALDISWNYLDMERDSLTRQVIRTIGANCHGGILCYSQNHGTFWER
jgi:Leucine-rich repeat (LRR) protein